MSNQPPRNPRDARASMVTLLVVIAIAAIYFINSGALAYLLPDLYPPTSDPAAVATATSVAATATQDFLEGTPETFLTTPTPVPAQSEPAAILMPEATRPAAAAGALPPATDTPAPPPIPARINGLPTITLDELPAEALETIALIDSGGPFPFDKDGSTFQNRERLLPIERSGFYREYTVITPGEDDRGARRIVGGADGTLYYTDDHYASFRVIVRAER